MNGDALSATLPKSADARDALLRALRKNFGKSRLIVDDSAGVVVLLSADEAAGAEELKLSKTSRKVYADAGVEFRDGESVDARGDAEERAKALFAARFPTAAKRRRGGAVEILRRTGSADFFALLSAPDSAGKRALTFVRARRTD